MNPIKYQTHVLWEDLSSKDTIKAYQKACVKTWNLLKETATLILMLLMLLVVFVVWLWNLGFRSGWGLAKWMDSENPEPQELVSAVIKSLKSSFTVVFNQVKDLVKENLGLDLSPVNLKLLNSESSATVTLNKEDVKE